MARKGKELDPTTEASIRATAAAHPEFTEKEIREAYLHPNRVKARIRVALRAIDQTEGILGKIKKGEWPPKS